MTWKNIRVAMSRQFAGPLRDIGPPWDKGIEIYPGIQVHPGIQGQDYPGIQGYRSILG